MNKLTISALVASTLLITACGDSENATGTTSAVGTEAEVSQLTQQYHDQMGSMSDSVVEAIEQPSTYNIKSPEGHIVGSPEDIAAKTAHYHKMMEEMKAAHAATSSHGIKSPEGHIVGSPEDIAAKTAQYHEMMKSLGH